MTIFFTVLHYSLTPPQAFSGILHGRGPKFPTPTALFIGGDQSQHQLGRRGTTKKPENHRFH